MYNGKSVSVILLAAGASTRMGSNKMLLDFGGLSPIDLCIKAFIDFADEFLITYSADTYSKVEAACSHIQVPFKLVQGGNTRQESVYNALCESSCEIVAVHDCARCLVTKEIIRSSIESAIEFGCGIASTRVTDTIRNAETGDTVDRDSLIAAQTPQSFRRTDLLRSYNSANKSFTDDAAVYKSNGGVLYYSKGSTENLKLTRPDDIGLFKAILALREE